MKTYISLFFFVALFSMPLFAQESGTLQLTVSNIKTAEGKIMVAVFNEASTFLTDNRYEGIAVPVTKAGSIEVAIPDLPFGKYALSIFHDKNDNDELDSNWMGIPKEPYGFSNNAKGSFGPPSYEKVVFDFEKDQQTHSVRVK
jgi:uncharacterized protein (DUF2141 family)